MSRISYSFYHFYRKGGCFVARSARLESGFQDRLIANLKTIFPGCMVFKMDQRQERNGPPLSVRNLHALRDSQTKSIMLGR